MNLGTLLMSRLQKKLKLKKKADQGILFILKPVKILVQQG